MSQVMQQQKTSMACKLMDELNTLGVDVSSNLDGDKLRILSARDRLSAEILQELKFLKKEILTLLALRKKSMHFSPMESDRHIPFPLTDIQRAYWVGHQDAFDLGSVCIHFYAEVKCETIDIARFNSAINKAIARHDMLRAVVDSDGHQVILDDVPEYKMAIIDGAGLADMELDALMSQQRQLLSHSDRDSSRWPGFSFTLAHADCNTDILFISIDLLHIDGGSLLILFDEIYKFYSDENYHPAPLEISYRDYVLTECQLQKTEDYQLSLDYWRKVAKDLPPAPPLPKRKNPIDVNRFNRRSFELRYEEACLLKERAASLSITPSTFVMMAFTEVIRQWSGSEDFCLNVTLFNRMPVHSEINKLIGDFTSMILLKIENNPNETLRDKAIRTQQLLWQHLEHRAVSGIKVLGELGRIQGYSQQVKMPIVFTSLLDLAGQGLPTRWLKSFGDEIFSVTQTPQVSLDHQVLHVDGGAIRLSWDVIEGLFPEGMIESMFSCYEQLIRDLILDKQEIWSQMAIALADPAHTSMQLAINSTHTDYERHLSLADLFSNASAKYPLLPALQNNGLCLTYKELLLSARVLAANLESCAIQQGSIVAIMMEKGWEQIVAVLGSHQAGCAYLPIDADLPRARIQYQLQHSGAAALICQTRLLEHCESLIDGPVIPLDMAWLEMAKNIDINTLATASPSSAESLSHVIYTSGSTGKPKGVMIEHRQVVNRILDINKRFAIGLGDKIIALTALHHDLSVYDIFGMLCAGGTVIIPDAELRRDPAHWYELLQTYRVTLWNSVPAYLDMLLDYIDSGCDKNPSQALRFCILAGDWIPVKQPKRMHSYWPELTFVASGGPTETTIWDIYNLVEELDPQADSIPYGKPLANSQYHILDAYLNPCPCWVPGEMYIAGEGVTPGYINDPQLTAERYVQLPQTASRCFKSGDLGRYIPDGNIEFLGRNDFQVKIRGLRIELQEIEAVVAQLPGVDSAVAMVKQTPQGPRIRLWIASPLCDQSNEIVAQDAANPEAQLADEQRDFSAQNLALTDAAERLLHKLQFKALEPAPNTKLLPLPSGAFSQAIDLNSRRDFSPRPVSTAELSQFLTLLRAQEKESKELKFIYGSAGGLYPIQIYLHVKSGAVQGLDAGLYRYYPREHGLAWINSSLASTDDHYSHNRQVAERSSFTVYFVEHKPTIEPLYGELSSAMCYLEVGMIAQALRTYAPTTGFGTCQIGSLQGRDIGQLLELSSQQTYLCCLVAGPLANDHLSTTAQMQSKSYTQDDLLLLVKNSLSQHLPQYMQPNDIEILEAMPLTANGKVDRKALNERELNRLHKEDIFVAPTNELEREWVAIFESLLNISPVSTSSNFFDLGANSAMIVAAYQTFKQKTGVTFKLISMFQRPTIAQLVAYIQQHKVSQEGELEKPSESRRENRRLGTLTRFKKE